MTSSWFFLSTLNISEVRGSKWSYTQLFSREGDPPPTTKEIPPVLSTLLVMYRAGTCSVLYFMSANELAVYHKPSPCTLQVQGHKSNHRDIYIYIYRFLQFTNILLKYTYCFSKVTSWKRLNRDFQVSLAMILERQLFASMLLNF